MKTGNWVKFRGLFFWLALGTIVFLSGCGAGGGGGSAGGGGSTTVRTIAGQVFDTDGTTPINRAYVALYLNDRTESPYLATTTGSNGGYEFSNVPQETCTIKIWRTQAAYNANPDSPLGMTAVTSTGGNVTNADVTAGKIPPVIASLAPLSGPVGSQVTVNGENFGSSQGTSGITFNGVSAGSAVTWCATRVVVAVPQGAGSGNVVLTVNGLLSNGAAFTVTSVTLNSITVSPGSAALSQGQTRQFTATGHYSDSSTADLTSQVTWSCDNPGAGGINSSGLFTASNSITGSQTAHLTASKSGKTSNQATVTVTYTAPALVSISLSPSSALLMLGQTQQFTVTANYDNGSSADVSAQASWSCDNASAGTINSSGLFTAPNYLSSIQTAHLTAQYGSYSRQASLTVMNGAALTSITVTPATAAIYAGGSQQFVAVGHYSNGSSSTITNLVTWHCDNASAGQIATGGLFTAASSLAAAQTANITATYSGKTSNSATVTAQPGGGETIIIQ